MECCGGEGVVCSQPSWIGVMKQTSWSLSTFPMTATCRWTTVPGSKIDHGDQCIGGGLLVGPPRFGLESWRCGGVFWWLLMLLDRLSRFSMVWGGRSKSD